jgi:predicted RNase H-like HicB family nuclease
VRRAFLGPGNPDLGITAYFTACGSTRAEALTTLASALGLFVDAVLNQGFTNAASKLQ